MERDAVMSCPVPPDFSQQFLLNEGLFLEKTGKNGEKQALTGMNRCCGDSSYAREITMASRTPIVVVGPMRREKESWRLRDNGSQQLEVITTRNENTRSVSYLYVFHVPRPINSATSNSYNGIYQNVSYPLCNLY